MAIIRVYQSVHWWLVWLVTSLMYPDQSTSHITSSWCPEATRLLSVSTCAAHPRCLGWHYNIFHKRTFNILWPEQRQSSVVIQSIIAQSSIKSYPPSIQGNQIALHETVSITQEMFTHFKHPPFYECSHGCNTVQCVCAMWIALCMKGFRILLAVIEMYLGDQETIRGKVSWQFLCLAPP